MAKKQPEYSKLKESYKRYLASYKFFNKGSLEGVTPFNLFYLNKVYVSKYSDPRRLMAQSGR